MAAKRGKPTTALCLLLGLLLATLEIQARPLTVTVWDFDNNSLIADTNVDVLRQSLAEQILSELAQVPGIRLVERVQLQKLLEEQRLSSSELVAEDERLRLGRIIGANLMVFGSYTVIGKQVRIDVRVVDVETSLTKLSEDGSSTLEKVMEEARGTGQRLASKLANTQEKE